MTTSQSDPSSSQGIHDPAHFVTTHISVLCRVKDATESERRQILDRICGAYWHPVYAYIRRTGRGVEDAKDDTQGFFLQLIRNGLQFDPAKGRFRSYLLGAVRNFLANRHKFETAQKRAPRLPLLSIDEEEAERRLPPDANALTPEQSYDRTYALALLQTVHAQLEAEYLCSGKAEMWSALQPCLARNSSEESYRDLALRLGKSEDAIKQQIKRMRLKYRVLLELEIGRNVADPAEIEDEIRWLESVFR